MFNRIRNYFAAKSAQKQMQVVVNLLDVMKAGKPFVSVWDVKEFNNAGYRRNSIIFSCITIKATAFMGPELLAYQENPNDEDRAIKPNHPLYQLLAKGYGRDSQSTFMRQWSTCLDVAGNAYALKIRARAGNPVMIKILRPDCMRPIPDKNGEIIAYEYGKQTRQGYTQVELETGKEKSGNEPQVIPAIDVIHEKAHPDPLDPYRGLSPIAVLARFGDLDNFAADYLRSFFLNAAIPSGILKVKQQMPPEERNRVREQWHERYSLRSYEDTKTGGAFELAIMDADVDYQEIGSKIQTMDLDKVFGETESRICATFGVHPILVATYIGLLRSTMDNYRNARTQLYNDTLLPVWISTADRFTKDLASEFGDNFYCMFDLSDVAELQKDRTEEKKLALDAWNDGLMTKNEAREEFNLDPDANGEVYKIKLTEDWIPAGKLPQAKPLPAKSKKEDQLALPAPDETHEAFDLGDWEVIKAIADKSVPSVKKKYSQQSHELKRELQSPSSKVH